MCTAEEMRNYNAQLFPSIERRLKAGCKIEIPWEEDEEEEEHSSQKARRVRRGDIIAIFEGETLCLYNDGNEPLQILAIVDATNPHNQLRRRSYYVSIATN